MYEQNVLRPNPMYQGNLHPNPMYIPNNLRPNVEGGPSRAIHATCCVTTSVFVMALVVSLALLLPTSVKPAKQNIAHTTTNVTVQANTNRHVEYTSSTHAPAASTEAFQMQAVNLTITKVTFGGRGSKAGRFSGLNNAAVSPSNEIFVADTLNRTVQVFNMEGAYLRKFPTVVSGEGSEAMDPLDISIDGEGHLWVIGETDTSEIIVSYTKKGRHIITIHPSSPNITFHDIAVDKLRNYVTITTAEQEVSGAGDVTVLLFNGTVVRKIETPQWWPEFITVDKNGRYLVTDMYKTDRVYIYSETGQYQLSLGGEGRISMPVGIYVDSSGNILVADEYDSSVEMFTDSGEHVRRVEPGVMFTGMALAPGGQLVLVNQMYSNVTILSRY